MTAFLYFEPTVPMVLLTVYEPAVDSQPDQGAATRKRHPAARCLAWLATFAIRLERCATGVSEQRDPIIPRAPARIA